MITLQRWIALFGAAALFFFLLVLFWALRSMVSRRQELLLDRMVGHDASPRIKAQRPRRRASKARSALLERLQLTLDQADLGVDAGGFLAICAGAALFMTLVGLVGLGTPLSGMVLGAALLLAIRLWVARRRDQRVQRLERQFPAALEMMTFGLRAGRSLEESIGVAAQEVEAPLAAELGRCHQEYSMGRPVEDALRQLAARWPAVRGLRLFVEAVTVLKQSGGNLVEVMESIRGQVRQQEAHEAKHRAMTSEGRFSGSILMALPLLALVIQVLLMPGQLTTMLHDGSGQMVLGAAVVLWAAGGLWVARLTRPARGGG